MNHTREFNAATVEEAIEKASKELGISRDLLSYEVLDSGSTGFIGIGARDARILVHTSEPVPAPEQTTTEEDALQEQPSSPVETPDGDSSEEAAPQELLEEIKAFTTHTLDAMEFDARVDVYDAGEFIAVDIASDETGLLIGQKGETIDALQYLINASIYRKRPFTKKIVLDSEGYRQRRIEAIQGMAHRTARRAVREGRTLELPPMNAAERRIVHLFLKGNESVTTASEGSGESRRVTISPL
jgi:spoIIIJ-associated protein